MKGAIADDLRHAEIQIDAGRKREIDSDRAQFGGHQPRELLRHGQTLLRIGVELLADASRGRQHGEALAEPLYATAFVIHRNQQGR